MNENYQIKMRRYLILLCIACFLPTSISGQQRNSNPVTPVYLNHLYIVLDKQTYDDIAASEFMRNQFADFEQKTTVASGGRSWTGTYIRGEQTYIELFNPENKQGYKQGRSAIGFGVEQSGGIEIVQNQLSRVGGKVEHGLNSRKINEQEIPWFHLVYVEYPDSTSEFVRWVMEYHKDYQGARYSDLKPGENGITRRQYLMRDYKPERYLKNISEVTIALDKQEADRFTKELTAFNYKIETHGTMKICVGSDIKLIIVPKVDSTEGIKQIKMSLAREKKSQKIYKFGTHSILRFSGRTATWTL